MRVQHAASDERTVSAFPLVCGPGERLPPAPPLWAYVEDGRIVFVHVGCPPSGAAMPAGWFEAVDAEGRSR